MKKHTILISGGGTGGHLFPALALAKELEKEHDLEPIFVGAEGKIEMTKVPQEGYKIYGLPIRGLQRKLTLANLWLPFRIIYSLLKCVRILRRHKPKSAIGTGGYASLPLLWVAQRMGIPTFVQEQNSYPGITNKLLSKQAKVVYTAYPKLEKYFPHSVIECLGNPVRFQTIPPYSPTKRLLILGGSLGAAAINQIVDTHLEQFLNENPDWTVQWQTGKLYYERYAQRAIEGRVEVTAFIENMSKAYSQADLIISRAGAGTLSELAVVGRATIMIPSPNVAENHQFHNASHFAQQGAVELIEERDLQIKLWDVLNHLAQHSPEREILAQQIKTLAKPQATQEISQSIIQKLNLC